MMPGGQEAGQGYLRGGLKTSFSEVTGGEVLKESDSEAVYQWGGRENSKTNRRDASDGQGRETGLREGSCTERGSLVLF